MTKQIVLLFLLCGITDAFAATVDKVYFIGNSLTHDTDPKHAYRQRFGYVEPNDPLSRHQISGSKTLNWFFEHPLNDSFNDGVNDDPTSNPWGAELSATSYDVLVLQPFAGTGGTKANDIAAISHWMNLPLQQDAKVLIHSGWPGRHVFLDEYAAGPSGDLSVTSASIAYMDSLVDDLRTLFPGRTIMRNKSIELLLSIHEDTENGDSPFTSVFGDDVILGDFYRDSVHMNTTEGYYLMSNHMRVTLGLEVNPDYDSPWFEFGGSTLTEIEKAYLNAKIYEISEPLAVPEPATTSTLGVLGLGLYVWRSRRRSPSTS